MLLLLHGEIGRRVAQLADNHGRIAALLMYDPALALKTLRAANVRLGPERSVRSCRQAVAHLGGSAVHGLVAQSALLETFRPPNEELAERIQAWWERSLLASSIAYVLAGMTERFDPEFASLVALDRDNRVTAVNSVARETLGLDVIVYINQDGVDAGVGPFTHGSQKHTDIMKTQALKQALRDGLSRGPAQAIDAVRIKAPAIADRLSVDVIFSELSALYPAFAENRPSPLEPPPKTST